MSNTIELLSTETLNSMINSFDISVTDIKLFQHNHRLVDYLVNGQYLLRVSPCELDEVPKLKLSTAVKAAPKIYFSGQWTTNSLPVYYVLMDYFDGVDLYHALPELTHDQQQQLGNDILSFIVEMQLIQDDKYDIGHYIPTVPRCELSWQAGHKQYLEYLKTSLEALNAHQDYQIIKQALEYIELNLDCLSFATGPVLLHNDLHPKNIIIKDGKMAGIIDWECAQFGEKDFELVHLFQWSIFPDQTDRSFDCLLRTLYAGFNQYFQVPNLMQRLTIYQLEHELNQIIWNPASLAQRIPRIEAWLDQKLMETIKNW